jgi:predicted dehydrogenase
VLKIALIGCGNMGGSHRRAVELLAGRARIVAAVDPDQERANAAAAALNCDKIATHYEEVLEDIDAAVVAAPHHLHHPIGMDLMAAGKHVLMEKPMANSESQCRDLISLSESAGVTFMVAYCMRFHPVVTEMARHVKTKTYGETFQLSMWTEQHTQRETGSWIHRKETLGGGQLFSHGCHYIDLLLDWMGDPIEGTHSGTNYGTPWMEGEGTSNVALKFESGALGYHFGTWGARGTRLKYSFHAHCTDGMLEAQISQGRLILHRDAAEDAVGREQVLFEAEPGKHVENELLHFVECVETGRRPLTDGPSSLRSLQVIWRLYEAEERSVVADLRALG